MDRQHSVRQGRMNWNAHSRPVQSREYLTLIQVIQARLSSAIALIEVFWLQHISRVTVVADNDNERRRR